MGYPKHQARRSGCKVGWLYYADKADAEKAAKHAISEGRKRAGQGYDFGYCAPGSIQHMEKGEYAGLYEVCIP